MGKSALASELARQAQQGGARVLWGRCWEGGGAPPYWPWIQILEQLRAAYDEATLRRHAGRGAPQLACLVPALADILPTADSIATHVSGTGRFWLFEAVATFLSNVASDLDPQIRAAIG